jgi:hypothetical protein
MTGAAGTLEACPAARAKGQAGRIGIGGQHCTSTPMPPKSLKTPATASTARTRMAQSGIILTCMIVSRGGSGRILARGRRLNVCQLRGTPPATFGWRIAPRFGSALLPAGAEGTSATASQRGWNWPHAWRRSVKAYLPPRAMAGHVVLWDRRHRRTPRRSVTGDQTARGGSAVCSEPSFRRCS